MKRSICDKRTDSAPISEELSGDALHNVSQLTTLLNWSIFGPVFAFIFHIPSLLSVFCWDIPKERHTQAFITVSVSLGTQPKTNVSNAHEFLISIRTPMFTFSLVEGD